MNIRFLVHLPGWNIHPRQRRIPQIELAEHVFVAKETVAFDVGGIER